MAKAKRKPFDPALEAARTARARANEDAQMRAEGIEPQIARWGDDGLSPQREAELKNQGAEVILDHRRRIKSAFASNHHQADIWHQLYSRDTLTRDQLNAVRDLQDLMAKRAGLGGRDEQMAYARDMTDEPFRDPCLVSDQMLQASVEMDVTLRLVGPPSQRVLINVLWPSVMGERCDWREAVKRAAPWAVNAMAQSALLVNAAQALVDVRPQVAAELKRRAGAKADARKANAERADPQALGV